MALVRVEMEQTFRWWLLDGTPRSNQKSIDLPADLIARCREVEREYAELQATLEHAYRHQQGLSPFSDSPYKTFK